MSPLRPANTTAGYLKAGLQGFQGSGKTFTAIELALGTRSHFGLDGPIAFFDTESGSDYVAAKVREATGRDLLVEKSRALDDLIATIPEAIRMGVAVLVVDSVSHLWREVCESYLEQVNEAARKRYGKKARTQTRLEFQDWGPIKASWARWTDMYLNADLHIIICGRAGYTYDYDTSGAKKELVKTGTKMKAEGEFGFEPSLLVEMEQIQTPPQKGQPRANVHRATVLKDRFDLLQGKVKEFRPGSTTGSPVWTFLRPHVERLAPDQHTTIDTEARTRFEVDGDGDAGWARERKQRTILSEEIKGELERAFPGLSKDDKAAKADLLERHFGTRSWTRVSEKTASSELGAGLSALRHELRPGDFPAPAATAQEQMQLDAEDQPPEFG